MGQEFFINSNELENKIRTLLPSQGGAGAGFDLSASTQIIPIIDLTESAEGSNLREDLQRAVSLSTVNTEIANATTTVISNTGFFEVAYNIGNRSGAAQDATFAINDGTTDTIVKLVRAIGGECIFDKFVVYLTAGDSFKVTSSGANFFINTQTRQIATIDGTLVNPLGFSV